MAQTYAATINPGLEFALQAELRSLGANKVKTFEGGASFRATNKVAYRAIKFLRCANQVRLRVDDFRARDTFELYKKVKRIEWSRLLADRAKVSLRVATNESRLNDTRTILGTTTEAMESLGYHVVDDGIEILVRIDDDRCTVSLDASGRELHKRGYRTEQVEAPIRESLAACCLQLSGALETGFVDPCCGSGTFVIEAAATTNGIAPRPDATYPVSQWLTFDRELFDAQTLDRVSAAVTFTGRDRDPRAIEIAKSNAERAGVSDLVTFEVADVSTARHDETIVTNPPYDERLKDKALAVVETLNTYPLATFIAPGRWRGSGKVLARFQNGGLPVKLVRSAAHSESGNAKRGA